jgi:hypothetical protein
MTSDYVNKLAIETLEQLDDSPRGQLIEKVLDSSLKSWSKDSTTLASEITLHPHLQARLAQATGYTPSKWLLERELEQIAKRRELVGLHSAVPPLRSSANTYARAADAGLMGLCFSGGGIRSASFNLGILQGLAQNKLLQCFDYLASVSGGGYIHEWLAAWSKRSNFDNVVKAIIPPPEDGNPGTLAGPIRWLRRYSNYLTPQVGLLSADTWAAFATWLRNTLLNQTIVFAGLFVLILVPHVLSFEVFAPRNGLVAVWFIGAIFCLSFLASHVVTKNMALLAGPGSPEDKSSTQGGVQKLIVLPLLIASLLFALLMPMIFAAPFGINLFFVFWGASFLLLVLALAIIFGGEALLAYVRIHTASKSVRELWHQPFCFVHAKFAMAVLLLLIAAMISAFCGAAWIVGSIVLIARLWAHTGWLWWRTVVVFLPPLTLGGVLVTMLFVVGLLGRTFSDERREWLARLAGWMGLCCLAWILWSGLSLYGHSSVLWLRGKLAAGIPVLIGWVGTWIGGLFSAKSSKSAGATADRKPSNFSAVEVLSIVGPYAFIAGVAVLLAAVAEYLLARTLPNGWVYVIAVFLIPLGIGALLARRVDINEFSLHAFYRNRLTRCYLGASNLNRKPNPFTGFDDDDADIAVSDLLPGDKDHPAYKGPFPIFCSTLNLTFGEDLAWQERKGASFVLTPLFSGYDVSWTEMRDTRKPLNFNGYVDTATYAYPNPGIHISTAVAISGAAVSPNMGFHSNPATAFLLTIFNVRLGWWLRNPRTLNQDGTALRTEDDIREDRQHRLVLDKYPWPSPHFSLMALIRELLGETNDTSNYVYLTDGAHFDNMGLYELVRRRCRYIVVCDAEEDGQLKFDGIGMAIRKCRIDFGVEIDLDLRPLEHIGDTQLSKVHCVTGTIRYPEDPDRAGTIVFIKSTLTGDEPADILNYKKEHASFPHDSTANQWFTESQFESYRRLGHHVACSVFEPAKPTLLPCEDLGTRSRYFSNLRHIWCPPTPEMDRYGSAHTEKYLSLIKQIRADGNLPGLFDMMFNHGRGNWKAGRSDEQIVYAVRSCYDLIEFMWIVFTELNLVLPENRKHPYARGWSLMFKEWAQIDIVQDSWKKYGATFSQRFRNFVQDEHIGLLALAQDSAANGSKSGGA